MTLYEETIVDTRKILKPLDVPWTLSPGQSALKITAGYEVGFKIDALCVFRFCDQQNGGDDVTPHQLDEENDIAKFPWVLRWVHLNFEDVELSRMFFYVEDEDLARKAYTKEYQLHGEVWTGAFYISESPELALARSVLPNDVEWKHYALFSTESHVEIIGTSFRWSAGEVVDIRGEREKT